MTTTTAAGLVVSALVDNDMRYARTDEEIDELVRVVVDEPHPGWASLLYVADRPCRTWDHEDGPWYPHLQLRVTTDPDTGWGAVQWLGPDGDRVTAWDSYNPAVPDDAPTLWADPSVPVEWRRSALVPLPLVRIAVREYLTSGGRRPSAVRWQRAERV